MTKTRTNKMTASQPSNSFFIPSGLPELCEDTVKTKSSSNVVAAMARVLLVVLLIVQLAGSAFAADVKLAWDANTESNLAGYNVYRSNQSGAYSTSPVNSGVLKTAAVTDSTAQSGQTYYYVVRAVNTDGLESVASNEVQTSIPALTAPSGLTSQCNANGTVTLKWNAVSGAQNYYVRADRLENGTRTSEIYLDQFAATTTTNTVVGGKDYDWYVHGANATSGIGPATHASFNCAAADKTAPTVTISSPVSGASVTGTVTINATATDNVAVAGVQFKVNGVNLGAEDTVAPFTASWNTAKLATGMYALTAIARDAAGNQTTSTTVSVKLTKATVSKIQTMDANGNAWDANATGALTVGYARMDAEANGVAIISLKNGETVVSETSVPATEPVTEGRIFVEVDGAVNTGVAMANDSEQAAEVSFYFTDSTGTDMGRGSFTLGAKQQMSMFANQAPFNLAGSMKGTMTFSSTVAVSVAALRGFTNERGEFLMTTLPVGKVGVAASGDRVVFPHFADGAGWMTQVVLTNPMDVALKGSVTFMAAAGTATTMTVNGETNTVFNYEIAPRSAVKMVTANQNADVKVGSVVVTPAANTMVPEGLSIFSYSNAGVTVSEAGVPAEPAGTEFQSYVESMDAVRSGLAMANASPVAAVATMELMTMNGETTGMTATVEIPAAGQVAKFADEMFPTMPAGFQGAVRMASSQPIAVVGLRLRSNERGDVLITSMPVMDQAAPVSNSNLVFPLVVNGGGYSTEFISINR